MSDRFWADRPTLVTGATGLVGSWLAEALLDRGASVVCLARLAARGYEVHAVSTSVRVSPDVQWHVADLLREPEAVALLAKVRPTHLLHLAWVVTPGEFWISPLNWSWVGASVAILRAFGDNGGVRAVFVGSCAEYDQTAGRCRERQTAIAPTTVYGASKAALGVVLPAFAAQHSVASTAWARLFYLYGPREHRERIVPSAILALQRNHPFACTSGRQIRDFMYVVDAADALVALLDSEVTGPVNVASGTPASLRDVLTLIGQQLGREHLLQFGARPQAAGEPPVLTADVTRLGQEVGWSSPTPLREGINRTIDWWQHAGSHER